MFLKMYNVKMLVPFSLRDGMQTLLEAPFSKHNLFSHVQSDCDNLLRFTVTLLYSERDKTNKCVGYYVSLTVASLVYDELQTLCSI